MQEFTTPMMRQYAKIKEQYMDCLLFFRLGDFYELFLDDAKVGSQVLNITLTRRPRGKDGDIPMCGVPFHAADNYIAKLVKAGHKVAICEQVSEPDTKGIVEREVIRIVTPGTILDEKALEKKEHNYTISISLDDKKIGLAAADLSTGDLETTEITHQNNLDQILGNELARFSPAECIVNKASYNDPKILKILSSQRNMNIYCFPDWENLAEDARRILQKHFKIKTLGSFDIEDKSHAKISCATLLGYLQHTQKDQVAHIKTIRNYHLEEFVIMDRSTITNLELFSTIRESDQRGSFIEVLDHTRTAMGGRMLREWIRKPLTKKTAIEKRLSCVEKLLENRELRVDLREILAQIHDIPRLLARLSVGIGNAVDLVNLKNSLIYVLEIKELIQADFNDAPSPSIPLPKGAGGYCNNFNSLIQSVPSSIENIINLIDKTIDDQPSIDPKNGGLIKNGINSELDKLRAEVGGGKSWITRLEEQEKKKNRD